jgi:RND family efflux transporter MFP subunit
VKLARTPAALLLLGAAACGAEARGEPAPDAVIAVRTAPVAEEWGTPAVVGTGTLSAKDEVALSFKIGGIVARMAVDEGASVRRGQVLATLDPAEIDTEVRKAEQGVGKAERDLARARTLYRDSVATLEQLQDATTGAEVARADLAAARFNRRYAAIVAPTDGVVLRRGAEAGEMVSPGAPVIVLGAAGGSVLRVGLPDRDAVRVRRGDAAAVRFDAFPGATFAGRVAEVAPAATRGTGTYEVEVAVDAEGRALASGLIGRVEIAPAARERLRLVPIEALLEADDDSATVYTLTPDGRRARRLPVRVAFLRGDRAAVSGGLDGVSEVVTGGAAFLEDGARVRRAVAP